MMMDETQVRISNILHEDISIILSAVWTVFICIVSFHLKMMECTSLAVSPAILKPVPMRIWAAGAALLKKSIYRYVRRCWLLFFGSLLYQ